MMRERVSQSVLNDSSVYDISASLHSNGSIFSVREPVLILIFSHINERQRRKIV